MHELPVTLSSALRFSLPDQYKPTPCANISC